MEFNRITLTKSGCRTIDYQISKDDFDKDGKLIEKRIPPKEGRKLDRIMEEFLKASDDFDVNYEKIISEFRSKSVVFARKLSKATLEEKEQIQQEVNSENLEIQEILTQLEKQYENDLVTVDLSDSDLELVNKYWNEVQTPRERKVRHQLALITDALNNPTKLSLVDGKYTPKVN